MPLFCGRCRYQVTECERKDGPTNVRGGSLPEKPPEAVNHPAHYKQGSLEVIDAIEGMALGFHEGNVVKYVARWRAKGGVQDLKKAAWYLNRLIERASDASPRQ